jgi:hypothetical protein
MLAEDRGDSEEEFEEESEFCDLANGELGEEFSVIPGNFVSSFFHIRHLDTENGIFAVAHRRAGWEAATRKSDHITVVRDCKQEWRIASIGVFPE